MKRMNFVRASRSGNVPTLLVDYDGTELFPCSLKCPFYDALSAIANPGLSARFDDVPGMWYSDGVRWRPFGGRVVLKTTYYHDVAATRATSVTSQCKVKIPYSLLNGSLFRNGDQIKIQSAYQRLFLDAGDTAKFLYRGIYAGKDANTPANNTQIHELNVTTTSNDGVPEHEFCFRRMDSTTVQVLGANNLFNMWNGPSASDLMTPMGVSDITNMDMNDTYLDWCLRWGVAPAVDAGVLYNALVEFVAAGE